MEAKIKKLFTHILANYSILFFVGIIVIIVLVGTICFHLMEGREWFDSFYFTSVTMSTIGYGDMAPLTHGGKIVSIIYGFMGAPLFIGLTGLLFQNNFQKLVKTSIHSYHQELKEAKEITEKLAKEDKKQNKEIKEAKELTQELTKESKKQKKEIKEIEEIL